MKDQWNGFDTFEDFFSGYTGEFKWRVEAKGPGDIAVTYVGYGHRMRGTDRLVLKEIYAESIWGRSHEGLGKIHVVAIDDLTPVGLTPEVL